MPQVTAGKELPSLLECHYRSPAETLSDLQVVRSHFSDLRLFVDFYSFPSGEKRRLVCLSGTVPVTFEGRHYNIPVCIWLHQNHPLIPPRCYVCPSVSMVINPACPYVDASGNIRLGGLSTWTKDASSLSLLVSEMRRAFQRDTPLYATPPVSLPTSSKGMQELDGSGPVESGQSSDEAQVSAVRSHGLRPPAPPPAAQGAPPPAAQGAPPPAAQAGRADPGRAGVGPSYAEELLQIDFGISDSLPPSSTNPFLDPGPSGLPAPASLSRRMDALSLDSGPGAGPQGPEAEDGRGHGPSEERSHPQAAAGREWSSLAARLPAEKAAMFLQLASLKKRSFSAADVMEAVQLSRDFPSALRFLSHCCPICQEQVSFSKIITMTHCSCSLCVSCFKSFFTMAILERSVDQLVCPQCGRPEVGGQRGVEESMEYFNLLDTQIRHYLPPRIHELFQQKLRDRALLEMKNFCWCAHCSFGVLHESSTLRMDCPSCEKSSCSQCRSAWSPQHQGVSCQQFRAWQQQNQPEQQSNLLSSNSIECPRCHFIFIVSPGGCLHFTCTQCDQQFCGGCSQTFRPGAACGFSADCRTKGLHAHHPRDCVYYLRDWSVARLQLLLECHHVSPSCPRDTDGSSADRSSEGLCSALEQRDVSGRREEPCGRPAPGPYGGLCESHYKERLVALVNRCRADPAVLFCPAEMTAELQRWCVAVPERQPEEAETMYAHRLLLTLTRSAPLRQQLLSPVQVQDDLCPPGSSVAAPSGVPSSRLLL